MQSRFSPLKYPHYRKYYFVQLISLVGTWSHDLARAWLILSLAEKSVALGGVLLTTAIPAMIFLIPGGTLVDRSNPKRTLIVTKTLLGLSALLLAYLTEFSHITYLQLLFFAFFEGLVGAFDFPALQTVASRLLPKEELQQVIALNATNFHMSRALGPLVAGLLLAWHGPSVVFFLDAISFFILAIALSFINMHLNLDSKDEKKQDSLLSWNSLLSGSQYILKNKDILYRVLQFFLSVSLLYPLSSAIFRAFFKIKFELSAEIFGYVFSASAFGALVGAVILTVAKPRNPMNVLKAVIPLLFGLHLLLIKIENIQFLYPIMFISGIFTFLIFATVNMSLQIKVMETFRGRIGSVIGLGWLAIGPMLSFPIGWFADHVGFETSVISISLTFLVGSAVLAYLNQRITDHK
ncbi:MAG: MFS transporter [Bdellovibrionales bacterium]|nr:MFS transporter [Bdellovibrionales bacterium]